MPLPYIGPAPSSATDLVTKAYVDARGLIISDTAPSSPVDNALWWDSSAGGGGLYIYFNDGSSSQWIELGIAGPKGLDGTNGTNGTNGDWTTAQTVATPTFSSNAYAIQGSDVGKLLLLTNGGTAGTVNINTSLGLTAGQRIDCIQTGSGQITFAGSATNNATPGLKMRAQYSAATILCVATNSYVIIGDLSA